MVRLGGRLWMKKSKTKVQLNGLEWGIEAGDNGGMGRDSSAVASYY